MSETAEISSLKGDITNVEKGGKKSSKGWFSSLFKKNKPESEETDPYGLTATQREKFSNGVPMLEAMAGQNASAERWEEAAEGYAFAARTYLLLGNRTKCSSHFVNSGSCLANEAQKVIRKSNSLPEEDPTKTELQSKATSLLKSQIDQLNRACEESQIAGHFTTAANILEDISKIQCDIKRPQTYDPIKGVKTLKDAANIYTQSGAVQQAIDCLSKLAVVYEHESKLEEAEDLWNECANHASEKKILQMSIIKYQFSALICRILRLSLNTDREDSCEKMSESLGDCMIENPQFSQIRVEYQFCNSLIDFIKNNSTAPIDDLIKSHSEILLPHHISLLRKFFGKKGDKKSFFSFR